MESGGLVENSIEGPLGKEAKYQERIMNKEEKCDESNEDDGEEDTAPSYPECWLIILPTQCWLMRSRGRRRRMKRMWKKKKKGRTDRKSLITRRRKRNRRKT